MADHKPKESKEQAKADSSGNVKKPPTKTKILRTSVVQTEDDEDLSDEDQRMQSIEEEKEKDVFHRAKGGRDQRRRDVDWVTPYDEYKRKKAQQRLKGDRGEYIIEFTEPKRRPGFIEYFCCCHCLRNLFFRERNETPRMVYIKKN